MMNFARYRNTRISFSLIPLIFLIYSCSQEPYELSASDRVVPSELSADSRELYRKLPIEGAHNFRDLGGYKTNDNLSVKWGAIYRSDALHDLTDQDLEYLERLKLKAIIDFRSSNEISEEPDRKIKNTEIHLLSIDPFQDSSLLDSDKSFQEIQRDLFSGEADLSNFLVDFNKDLVTKFSPVYKDFIDTLIANEGLPIVFHCTAGKDRAGFAAALVLSILGVPRDIIIKDYLATNSYTKESIDEKLMKIKLYSFFQANTENLRKVMGAEERYIQAAFDAIDHEWGSMEAFYENGLELSQIEIDKLRSFYLE